MFCEFGARAMVSRSYEEYTAPKLEVSSLQWAGQGGRQAYQRGRTEQGVGGSLEIPPIKEVKIRRPANPENLTKTTCNSDK